MRLTTFWFARFAVISAFPSLELRPCSEFAWQMLLLQRRLLEEGFSTGSEEKYFR